MAGFNNFAQLADASSRVEKDAKQKWVENGKSNKSAWSK